MKTLPLGIVRLSVHESSMREEYMVAVGQYLFWKVNGRRGDVRTGK